MPKYNVKSPLRHDGKDYKVGAKVELTEEQAAALVASNTVEAPAKEEPKAGEKK